MLKTQRKDPAYISVNQLIQPKKGNGKSIMPPYHASLQAKSGGVQDESTSKQTNHNLKQVYKALTPDLKMIISLAELESGFGAGFLESAQQKVPRANFASIYKELSQPENLIQFYLGSKVGMGLGALKDLRDNIAGLWQFVKLGFKYSPAMQLYEWTFNTKNKIKQTQENIKQVTELIEGIYQFARELNHNPVFLQEVGKELGTLAGQESAKWFTDKFIKMSSFDKGKTVGEVAGYIVMEIVLLVIAPEELATKGAALAGKASKSSKLVTKVIEQLSHIPGLKKILTARGYLKDAEAAVETEKIAAVSAKEIRLTGKDAEVAVIKEVDQSMTVAAGTSTYSFKGLASRHYYSSVKQGSVAKDVNTVIMPGVDLSADITAINAGKAIRNGNTFAINGRIYGMHDGTLYPISGSGLVTLDRGGYKALGVYKKFGDTPQANTILDNMGVGLATKNEALKVYREAEGTTN